MNLSNRLSAIGGVIVLLAMFLLNGRAYGEGGSVWVELSSEHKNQSAMRSLITELNDSPFDEVIIKVVDQGNAWFQSSVLPMPAGASPGLDPLAFLIQGLKQSQKPKRIVAWVDPLAAGNENELRTLDANHILNVHRDWLSQSRDGRQTDSQGNYYLEPSLPDVQAMLSRVVEELCTKYPIDGLYVDSISDPTADWGFHPEFLKTWQEEHPDQGPPLSDAPEWLKLRAQALSALVGRLAQVAGDAGKEFSAGAMARGPVPESAEGFARSAVFTANHQDWPTWLREGLVQRLILKVFVVEGANSAIFDQWVAYGVKIGNASGVPVEIGVSGSMNQSVDVLAQMRRASTLGAKSLVVSNFKNLTSDRGARTLFLRAIERTVFNPDYIARLQQRASVFGPDPGAAGEQTALADGETNATPSTDAAAPGDDTIADVPDQTDYSLPPPPIEEATGKIIALEKTDREMAEALNVLTGAKRPPASASAPPAPRQGAGEAGEEAPRPQSDIEEFLGNSGGVYTRQDMLHDIINDPRYIQSQSLFARSTEARDYLRKMYPNIF